MAVGKATAANGKETSVLRRGGSGARKEENNKSRKQENEWNTSKIWSSEFDAQNSERKRRLNARKTKRGQRRVRKRVRDEAEQGEHGAVSTTMEKHRHERANARNRSHRILFGKRKHEIAKGRKKS